MNICHWMARTKPCALCMSREYGCTLLLWRFAGDLTAPRPQTPIRLSIKQSHRRAGKGKSTGVVACRTLEYTVTQSPSPPGLQVGGREPILIIIASSINPPACPFSQLLCPAAALPSAVTCRPTVVASGRPSRLILSSVASRVHRIHRKI